MSFPGQLRRVGSSADHFRSPKQRTSHTKAATSEKCQTRTSSQQWAVRRSKTQSSQCYLILTVILSETTGGLNG